MKETPSPAAGRTLVIGIGNEVLRDEGFGVHVARALASRREALPPGVAVVEAGLSLLELAPEMARHEHVVLVDAVRAGGEPGTLYRLEVEAGFETRPPRAAALSLHQWGVEDTLRAIALMKLLPPRVTIVGAEVGLVEPGLGLTPAVAASAERLVDGLLRELGANPHACAGIPIAAHSSAAGP